MVCEKCNTLGRSSCTACEKWIAMGTRIEAVHCQSKRPESEPDPPPNSESALSGL